MLSVPRLCSFANAVFFLLAFSALSLTEHFDCDEPWSHFLHVSCSWGLLNFLDLSDYSFHQIWKSFGPNVFNCFSCLPAFSASLAAVRTTHAWGVGVLMCLYVSGPLRLSHSFLMLCFSLFYFIQSLFLVCFILYSLFFHVFKFTHLFF